MGTRNMNHRHWAAKMNRRMRAAICGWPSLGSIREEGMLFVSEAPLPPGSDLLLIPPFPKTRERMGHPKSCLDIQVLHVESIVFDELAARLDVFAHERGEDVFSFSKVLELYFEQGAALGIHCGLPKLLRTHFAEAFVALHGVFLAALVQYVVEEVAHSLLLHRFRFRLALGGLRALLFRLLLVGALGIAQLFLGVAGRRFLLDGFNEVRWLQVLLNLLVLRHHLAVLRRGSQLPVDDVRSALRVDEDTLPQAVLLFEALLDRLETLFLHDDLQAFLEVNNLLRRAVALAFEVGALGEIEARQQFGDHLVADALVHLVHEADVLVECGHELG